jgi:hypothetical protein
MPAFEQKRAEMIEHLEAALALADELKDTARRGRARLPPTAVRPLSRGTARRCTQPRHPP